MQPTLRRQTSASRITAGERLELLVSIHSSGSGGNFSQFLPGAGFSPSPALLWRLPPAYFPLSSPLYMKTIICKNGGLSRAEKYFRSLPSWLHSKRGKHPDRIIAFEKRKQIFLVLLGESLYPGHGNPLKNSIFLPKGFLCAEAGL